MNRRPDSIEIVDRRFSAGDHLEGSGKTYIVCSSAAMFTSSHSCCPSLDTLQFVVDPGRMVAS